MKINLMRKLDAWLGVPLCAAATVAVWVGRLFGRGDRGAHSRLLIIKLSELGANVMLGDMVRASRRVYSRENTWFMAFAESGEILRVMDFVPPENLLLVPTKSLPQFAIGLARAIWRARRAGVDTALDLEFFSRCTALISWLSGARRRVGIHAFFGEGSWRGQLMTHRVKYNPHLHISRMMRSLGEAMFMPGEELQRMDFAPPPEGRIQDRFRPTAGELAAVEKLLVSSGWNAGERIVLLNANTSDRELIPLRRWSEERYAEVARRVLEEFPDVRVVLTGSPREVADVGALERRVGSPRCVSFAGKTSFRELLTLYTQAALMVTNDSGPGHFAALTDMAIVVLVGPESPQLWRPLGRDVRVVYRGLACSPCFSVYNGRTSGCVRNICMDISPDEVMRHVRELLREPNLSKQP